ncbi:MAG: hemolysin III family protein [Actinomycetes bacterium]
MVKKIEQLRSDAGETVERLRGEATALAARVKPRFRGVIHYYSFWTALALGIVLIALANGAREIVAMVIYGAGICGLFGVSALYHRHTWQPKARAWMRRLDHSMIFVFIAASFTPFALLVLHGALSETILIVVWAGALAGVVLTLLWVNAPKWLSVLVYVALSFVAFAAAPQIYEALGWLPIAGLALGGALYIAGGIIYALGRPDPAPETFGYHEIFHSLVSGAAGAHYAVIVLAVLPFAG